MTPPTMPPTMPPTEIPCEELEDDDCAERVGLLEDEFVAEHVAELVK